MKAEKIHGDAENSIVIALTDSGFEIAEGWGSKIFYPWADVSELSVEGPDAIQKRITASRLLLTGVFAFAFKKKTGEAFAFIDFKYSNDPMEKLSDLFERKLIDEAEFKASKAKILGLTD